MPRHHRRRRLEWTNSMQSDTTVVELAVEPHNGDAAAGSADVDANTRPLRIRSAAPGPSQTTAASTALEGQSIVRQSAPVTRSDSEQTTAATPSTSDVKMEHGLGRRIKESIVRKFRLFSGSLSPSHTSSRTHGSDGYYAVSLY
ncbi:hypothetical protein GGI23_006313 [Coemansia sp. RSA 2559]|nr:hypothetical protein GGI23_006313 [Coemansia sp. RSA 2559]KAJ2849062.1 hypothetical protein GGI22_005604 [Coemansia erecta]